MTTVNDVCLGTAPHKTEIKGVNIDITKDTKTTTTKTTTTTTKDTVKRVGSESGSAAGRKTGGKKGRCFWLSFVIGMNLALAMQLVRLVTVS